MRTTKRGTKSGGSGSPFLCLMSGSPMPFDYLRAEGKAGRLGSRLLAVVAEGDRERVYLTPTADQELRGQGWPNPIGCPKLVCPSERWAFACRSTGCSAGVTSSRSRQLVALTTFSDLVGEAMERIRRDAVAAGLPDDKRPLRDGGTAASAYAEAVGVYLAFAISPLADRLLV